MRLVDNELRLSASDLAKHLGCGHLTLLDRASTEGQLSKPLWKDPALEILKERGLIHENAYVDRLKEQGRSIFRTSPLEEGAGQAMEQVHDAMRRGEDVIVQAVLADGGWFGVADILQRVERPSDLGDWSYEVYDTKLATETRGGTILQLCLYSDLVQRIQGIWPERMYVVSPGADFPTQDYRLDDFLAYYRFVCGQLLGALDANRGPESLYPEPAAQCDVCAWWKRCADRRREDDHLSLIAGMPLLHARELQRQGVATLTRFAEEGLPDKPERGAAATFERLRGQATIQLAGRRANEPLYERLPAEPKMGLARLPEPDPGDVFFDIEGDRFLEEGGREDPLGYALRDAEGKMTYEALWGLDATAERRAFENLIDFLIARWDEFRGMHVYHFAPYEPAAIKRLMGRHATREDDVDRLLRGDRFVDLYDIVRHSVRASVESYSIKELEQFTGYKRSTDLRDATKALRAVSMALALKAPGDITEEIRDMVQTYNEDDCVSTADLQTWLERVRAEAIEAGETIERPEDAAGDASDNVDARRAEVQAIYERLVEGMPDDPDDRSDEESARWLLAQLLDYFRREEKGTWWEFFRLHELSDQDLLDERSGLSMLELVGPAGGTARCPVHRYRFPAQETKLDPGDKLEEPRFGKIGSVEAIDATARTVDIKKTGAAADRHPGAVFVFDHVRTTTLESSMLAVAKWIADEGFDAPGPHRAARDLLLRLPPRMNEASDGPLRRDGENVVEAARRLALGLGGGLLPVQGPPGSGKTFSGARMILSLLREGRSVGVTAVSHKVIRNLLEAALEAAEEEGDTIAAVHKGKPDGPAAPDGIKFIDDNAKVLAAIGDHTVVGGTAWLWSRDEAQDRLDTLIVDEAGQMSLAGVLAVSRAARNIILLGDPQQLQQPQQGSHPDGSDAAALVHILDGRETIPDDRGLFLDETWRLAPPIADLTSELYYEGRLASHAGLEGQEILGDHPLAGAGLFVVPVEHEGNQSSSPEEADAVVRIVRGLLAADLRWKHLDGKVKALEEQDILVVSPYNAQVAAILERRPTLRVGTVDKFQGQEAALVIYSMATSRPEDAPRGMGFLYEPNRFNVATSRARCACVVVASPKLFEPECHTVEQMRRANGLCRYLERGTIMALNELDGTAAEKKGTGYSSE